MRYETKLSKLYKVGRDKCQTYSEDMRLSMQYTTPSTSVMSLTQFISMSSEISEQQSQSFNRKFSIQTGFEVTVIITVLGTPLSKTY